MRTLTFDPPSKPSQSSRIHDGKSLHNPRPEYYNRFVTIETKYAIVVAVDFDWQTNTGKLFFTDFHTIIKGVKYGALLKQGKLSDRQLRWMATHFIKQIVKLNNL